MKGKSHDLNHDLTFSAHTINCVCHSIRSMFRVLGIYNFAVFLNAVVSSTSLKKSLEKVASCIILETFIGSKNLRTANVPFINKIVWFKRAQGKGNCRKLASSNTSCLEAHAGFYRLLMKGIFDPEVLWPFEKKLIS